MFQLFTVPDLLLQAFHSHLSLSGLGLPVRQGPVLGILAAQGLVLGLQGLAAGFIGFGCYFPLLALAFTGFGPFLMLFDVVPFRQGFRAHSRQGMSFRAADRAGLALFQFRRQDSCLGLQEQGPDAFIGNAFVPGFGRRFFQEGPAVLPLFLRFFSLSFQLSRFAFALEPVVQGLPAGFGLFRRDGLFGQAGDGFPGLVQGLLFPLFFLSGLIPALFGVSHVFLALPFFEAAGPIGSGLVLQACQLHLFFTGRLIALFPGRKAGQLLLSRGQVFLGPFSQFTRFFSGFMGLPALSFQVVQVAAGFGQDFGLAQGSDGIPLFLELPGLRLELCRFPAFLVPQQPAGVQGLGGLESGLTSLARPFGFLPLFVYGHCLVLPLPFLCRQFLFVGNVQRRQALLPPLPDLLILAGQGIVAGFGQFLEPGIALGMEEGLHDLLAFAGPGQEELAEVPLRQ